MSLTELEWKTLLRRIAEDKCTPFLGSELSCPSLPKRSDLARRLADDADYPLADRDNLARVTQFLATQVDNEEAQYQVLCMMKAPAPNFAIPGEPHAVLARLPLSVYITTAYDNYMFQALQAVSPIPRSPLTDYCRWQESLQETTLPTHHDLNPANPLVYHLHGLIDTPQSLVLTEDHYLDYLAYTSSAVTNRVESTVPQGAIPPVVREAFAKPSLLFLGYRIDDLEFRVLLRTIARQLAMDGQRFSVQLIQANGGQQEYGAEEQQKVEEQLEKVRSYLTKYCSLPPFRIRAFWVSARDFLTELEQRFEEYMRQNDASPQNVVTSVQRAA